MCPYLRFGNNGNPNLALKGGSKMHGQIIVMCKVSQRGTCMQGEDSLVETYMTCILMDLTYPKSQNTKLMAVSVLFNSNSLKLIA